MRIQPAAASCCSPTPPPDIDLEAWHRTLDEIERRAPERLALVHFGVADDAAGHLARAARAARPLGRLVGDGATEEEWTASVLAEIRASGEQSDEEFESPMPLWQSYAGLRRYWDKKAEAAA